MSDVHHISIEGGVNHGTGSVSVVMSNSPKKWNILLFAWTDEDMTDVHSVALEGPDSTGSGSVVTSQIALHIPREKWEETNTNTNITHSSIGVVGPSGTNTRI